jgi:hypothetical protein
LPLFLALPAALQGTHWNSLKVARGTRMLLRMLLGTNSGFHSGLKSSQSKSLQDEELQHSE